MRLWIGDSDGENPGGQVFRRLVEDVFPAVVVGTNLDDHFGSRWPIALGQQTARDSFVTVERDVGTAHRVGVAFRDNPRASATDSTKLMLLDKCCQNRGNASAIVSVSSMRPR